jgi:hypothetical protein
MAEADSVFGVAACLPATRDNASREVEFLGEPRSGMLISMEF